MAIQHIFMDLFQNHRKAVWPVVVGVCVNCIFSLILMTFLWPRFTEDRAALVRQRIAALEAKARVTENAVPRTREELERFYRGVSDYRSFPDFLKQLSRFAGDAGLRIDSINYRPEKSELQTILKYTLDFSVTGKYRQIRQLLDHLENWSLLVVVEEVRLSARQPERDEVVLSIRLTAYFKTVAS